MSRQCVSHGKGLKHLGLVQVAIMKIPAWANPLGERDSQTSSCFLTVVQEWNWLLQGSNKCKRELSDHGVWSEANLEFKWDISDEVFYVLGFIFLTAALGWRHTVLSPPEPPEPPGRLAETDHQEEAFPSCLCFSSRRYSCFKQNLVTPLRKEKGGNEKSDFRNLVICFFFAYLVKYKGDSPSSFEKLWNTLPAIKICSLWLLPAWMSLLLASLPVCLISAISFLFSSFEYYHPYCKIEMSVRKILLRLLVLPPSIFQDFRSFWRKKVVVVDYWKLLRVFLS